MARRWFPGITAALRAVTTFTQREMVFDRDENRPYVGDGATLGGLPLALGSDTDALSARVGEVEALTENLTAPVSSEIAPLLQGSEQGLAAGILAARRAVATYAALTALTADTGLYDNGVYCTYGRAIEEDGGFGFWRYDAGSTATADSGTILAVDGGGAGRFFRLYERGIVRAEWFGDLSSAFSATLALAISASGIGGTVIIPRGNYSMSAGVTLLAKQAIVFEPDLAFNEDFVTAHTSSVTRAFSGTAFDMSAPGCGISGLNWDGVGATYSGVCAYIASGEQQWLGDCDIDDQQDACLQFVGADAGQRFAADNCGFRRTTPTDPAVLLPTDSDTAGNRQFRHCSSYGGVLLRLNNSANTHVLDSKFRNLDFSGSDGVALRAIIANCRIASSGDPLAIYGNDCAINGNVVAGGITLNGAASRNRVAGNNLVSGGTITDNSTATGDNVNEIWDGYYSPAIVWKGDSSDPDIGDGTLSCRVYRSGRKLKLDVVLVAGSTTTFGSGAWYFELPAPLGTWVAKASAVGTGRILDLGTAYFMAVPVISAGSKRVYLWLDNSGSNVNVNAPMTWAAGDTLTFSVEFEIS